MQIDNIHKTCKLTPSQLKRYSEVSLLPSTTNSAEKFDITFGQQRAVNAIRTGLAIATEGYHIYTVGSAGLDKRALIEHLINEHIIKTTNKHLANEPLINQQSLDTHIKAINTSTNSSHKTPIIFADLATFYALMGHNHVGYQSFDTGVLQKANGGYLMLNAKHLLDYPYAWHALKLALTTKKINPFYAASILPASPSLGANEIPNFAPNPVSYNTFYGETKSTNNRLNGSLNGLGLEVDLEVKVILLGEADTYDELSERDPEFVQIFGVRAEFDDTTLRTTKTEHAITAKIATLIKQDGLLPLDKHAIARVLEQLSLEVEDQNRLSLNNQRLKQLLHEANRHAQRQANQLEKNQSQAKPLQTDPLQKKNLKASNVSHRPHVKQAHIKQSHIKKALADITQRSNYLKALYWQELQSGQQLISTQGKAIGQINALTVIDYANDEFGMPARLTALIQPNMGTGDVLDIERDVELGGSLHAKGMLIMSSYLRALLSPHHSLNFSASLAFEQSYAHIDGDSATLAEACALLSALANVPIKQSLAVTGSMNQLAEVQAVGGINAKIIGFYDACCGHGFINKNKQGLTGNQGVIIPAANINHLMLPEHIIEAVKNKQFHIYAVDNLYQALTLLTDLPVSIKTKKGKFAKGTLFAKISKRLRHWEDIRDIRDGREDAGMPLELADTDKKSTKNKAKLHQRAHKKSNKKTVRK